MNFSRLSPEEVQQLRQDSNAPVIDIRDLHSFQLGHLPGAIHIETLNLDEFLETADFDAPLIVYCYHGNSSQPAAAYFADKGFNKAISMDGGFDVWARCGYEVALDPSTPPSAPASADT